MVGACASLPPSLFLSFFRLENKNNTIYSLPTTVRIRNNSREIYTRPAYTVCVLVNYSGTFSTPSAKYSTRSPRSVGNNRRPRHCSTTNGLPKRADTTIINVSIDSKRVSRMMVNVKFEFLYRPYYKRRISDVVRYYIPHAPATAVVQYK